MDNKKRGQLGKAGKLLSNFIRLIAEEETELVKDPGTGEDRIATKAEALARLIWKRALGYTESKMIGKELVDTTFSPDKSHISLIFDRMEGRVTMTTGDDSGKMTTAERVSQEGKKRIAGAGKLDVNDG